MSGQWTDMDPGSGSMDSVSALATALNTLSTTLDLSKPDLQKSLGVFEDDWRGKAADAAKARISGFGTQINDYIDAAIAVKKALEIYAETVAEIKTAADEIIQARDAALERIENFKPDSPPIPSSEGGGNSTYVIGDAQGQLLVLADQRRTADTELRQAVRAVIALTWDLPSSGYPTDRPFWGNSAYGYDKKHRIKASPEDYTVEELMEIFKNHPAEIFPFPVDGDSSTFHDGAIFRLRNMLPPKWAELFLETGYVVVTTTDNSVKFTVVNDEYFDEPGSTIEFSIIEEGGSYYIRKVAQAEKGVSGADPLAPWFAEKTWTDQAKNFDKAVDTYG